MFESRDEIDDLIDQYESIMDQLDNFNRKVWNHLYPADVFGHGMDLIKIAVRKKSWFGPSCVIELN